MKSSLKIIKFIFLLGLIGFLFSFTNKRNEKRKVSKIDVKFVDETRPFITIESVDKLLIQSEAKLTDIGRETLDLREMEERLRENPMIRDAQVYLTIDGVLGAKIIQRNPIGRVASSPDYYIDDEGKTMPLSEVYSARVPIITGTSDSEFTETTFLLNKINNDEFMKNTVVGLVRKQNGEIELELRKIDLKIVFGQPVDIEKKFQNFKAFYKKTKQDSTLEGYHKVNLKFGNQVIATKRLGYGK